MIGDRDTSFPSNVPHRAVIDIGSNTVRLVVYGGAQRAPTALLNERVAARLGAELMHDGMIPEAAIEIALRGLRRYRRILTDLHIHEVDVIATAAARLADNGPVFLERVWECGFSPVLLTGEEEARTSAMGVIGAFPGAKGVVADLGGGSLELVEIRDGQCLHGVSLPLGALMLGEMRAEGPAKFKRKINRALKNEDWAHPVAEPGDLLSLPLLHTSTRADAWNEWLTAQGLPPRPGAGMVFEQFATTAQAAEAGLGVALLPTLLVRAELDDGTLVPAIDRPHRSARAYYLVHPRGKANHPPFAAFRQWLLAEARGERPPPA